MGTALVTTLVARTAVTLLGAGTTVALRTGAAGTLMTRAVGATGALVAGTVVARTALRRRAVVVCQFSMLAVYSTVLLTVYVGSAGKNVRSRLSPWPNMMYL